VQPAQPPQEFPVGADGWPIYSLDDPIFAEAGVPPPGDSFWDPVLPLPAAQPAAPTVAPAPIAAVPLPVDPAIQRKREIAVARLQEIKARLVPGQRPIPFGVVQSILSFDLDVALRPYSGAVARNAITNLKGPKRLLEMYDWAGRDDLDAAITYTTRRQSLNGYLGNYGPSATGRGLTARTSLCQLFNMWTVKKEKVRLGQLNEDTIKTEIRTQMRALQDAHANCIDQVNGQIENILLDALPDLLENRGQVTKIQQLAGCALFKYRSNLLKNIVRQQNPNEVHMADLEREVKNRVGIALGIHAAAVSSGAAYQVVENVELKSQRAMDEFARLYNNPPVGRSDDQRPLGFLKRDLQTYHGYSTRVLRAEMLKRVLAEYDLENAYNDDLEVVDETAKILVRVGSREGEDGFLQAQSWSDAGAYWYMEQLGLTAEAPPGR
jgi:hypothetical protein